MATRSIPTNRCSSAICATLSLVPTPSVAPTRITSSGSAAAALERAAVDDADRGEEEEASDEDEEASAAAEDGSTGAYLKKEDACETLTTAQEVELARAKTVFPSAIGVVAYVAAGGRYDVYDIYGLDYTAVTGVYRPEDSCGSCTSYAMNSDAMATYEAATNGIGWTSVAPVADCGETKPACRGAGSPRPPLGIIPSSPSACCFSRASSWVIQKHFEQVEAQRRPNILQHGVRAKLR